MFAKLCSPSVLPSCILAGVGIILLVLAATLPPGQVVALIGGTAVVTGLFVARLRRDEAGSEPVKRFTAKV